MNKTSFKEYFFIGELSKDSLIRYINNQISTGDKMTTYLEIKEKIYDKYEGNNTEELINIRNGFKYQKFALENNDISQLMSLAVGVLTGFITLVIAWLTISSSNYDTKMLLAIATIFISVLLVLFLGFRPIQSLYSKRVLYYQFKLDTLADMIDKLKKEDI